MDDLDSKKLINILMQPKELVNTSYEISAVANRIFYYILYKAQKTNEDKLALSVRVSEKELKSLIKNFNDKNTEKLNEIFSIMLTTQLYFIFEDENNKKDCAYTLISGFEYSDEDKSFEVFFMKRIYEYIKKYNKYAPIDLSVMNKLDTFYSQKFYVLFRMWSRTENKIVTTFKLEFLRKVLSIENKYPDYKNLKQKILKPSLIRLNKFANMDIEFTEIKKERKVVAIEFSILDKSPKVYNFRKNKNLKDNDKEYFEKEKFVSIPNKNIFDKENLKKIVEFCYDKLITFRDKEYEDIFFLTIVSLVKKKGINIADLKIDNIGDYTYFEKTLIGKINDFEKKIKI